MKVTVSMAQEAPERWHAWVPELPGCAACGKSQQDTQRRIDQAIRGYLASWDAVEPDDLVEEVVKVELASASRVSVSG